MPSHHGCFAFLLVGPKRSLFFFFLRGFCRPAGLVVVFKGAQPPSLILRGSVLDITKPTSNINLASINLCLVTAVTGGLSFV